MSFPAFSLSAFGDDLAAEDGGVGGLSRFE
jgi:hypothetical protein